MTDPAQSPFEPPSHWAPPQESSVTADGAVTTGSRVAAALRESGPSDALAFSPAVEDPADRVDVEASPAAWLSGRALLMLSLIIGVLLVATAVGCVAYWHTPPMHAIDVPLVPKA